MERAAWLAAELQAVERWRSFRRSLWKAMEEAQQKAREEEEEAAREWWEANMREREEALAKAEAICRAQEEPELQGTLGIGLFFLSCSLFLFQS